MEHKHITIVFIVSMIILTFVYDLFAYMSWGHDATISVVIRNAPCEWQVLIALGIGMLFGHLFLIK